jgi:NADPH:quinone reductase-like Zn-dependent oxidoreductase
MIKKLWVSMTSSQKLVPLPLMKPDKQHMLDLKEFLETGKVKPVIDRRYQLSELPDAISYLGEGHARGKIIVAIHGD